MNDIDHLCQRLPSLENCRDSIQQATDLLIQSFQQGNKLLLCGNGGSAADCEHIAGELIKRFSAPRPLPSELSGL
ncbi:MAG: SIS domain-containing protein, partial [Verrucomicrobia bacterium]|nr:SIS domain-containing protein [Verrucomicrobiota bacterium]